MTTKLNKINNIEPQYVTIPILVNQTFQDQCGNNEFVILSSGRTVISCEYSPNVFRFKSDLNFEVIIDYFDSEKDIINLSNFKKIHSISDISFSTNPLRLMLYKKQTIVLTSHKNFDTFHANNFIFSKFEHIDEKANFNKALFAPLAIFFGLSAAVALAYKYGDIVDYFYGTAEQENDYNIDEESDVENQSTSSKSNKSNKPEQDLTKQDSKESINIKAGISLNKIGSTSDLISPDFNSINSDELDDWFEEEQPLVKTSGYNNTLIQDEII
jgi:hypothetical protein